MNKKQNILLWYLTIALVVLLFLGFNNGDLEKLNDTTFSILILTVVGSCALVTTQGVNGLDLLTIKLKIFPVIYILFLNSMLILPMPHWELRSRCRP